MNSIIQILILTFIILPSMAKADIGEYRYKLGATYGAGLINPAQLNSYRDGVNPAKPPAGKFSYLAGYSVSAGFQILRGMLSLQYSDTSQTLSNGINGGSCEETFDYQRVYLVLDYTLAVRGSFVWAAGAGIGKSLAFAYHQKFNGQDINWSGDAVPAKLHGSLGYILDKQLEAILDVQYEFVSSDLKAKGNYNSDLSGNAVADGATLRGSDSRAVSADLSGISAGLGLAFMF